MYYFAYINGDNICTNVYAMPSDLSGVHGYISITEAQYNSQSVIGMRWNASTSLWEEVLEYYYAVIDSDNIVINLIESDSEMTGDSFIEITKEQYEAQSILGYWYNREDDAFEPEVPFAIIAEHSTDQINYRETNIPLSDLLDSMPLSDEVYTKEQADAKFALIGGTGGASGEDGGFYTPTVAENGDLSWTASKDGMPAVATVNINGADGAAGINGVTFTPVMVGTTLSWTNDGGLQNPPTVDLKGEKGDAGDAAAVDAYTKSQVDIMFNGKADADHSHDYAPSTHSHDTGDISGLTAALNGKADSSHTHTGYASSTHTHSGYASSSHTHSNYFPSTGGTITGETNFSGGLIRLKGVQGVFHSGSQLVYGSNSMPTRIAGSAISATKTITVDSDLTLKENIDDVDAADCVNFIDGVDVMTYNYKGDSEECIGVIAQDIEDLPLAKYLVRTTAEGKKAVKVADLVFPLIVAVQELSARVAALEK